MLSGAIFVTELSERLNAFKVRISKVEAGRNGFQGRWKDLRTEESLAFPRNRIILDTPLVVLLGWPMQ